MNGLGLPTPQPSIRELEAQLAMTRACQPIEQENIEAKQAYREALESGDQEAIAAAKERKQAAADRINETRTWLRREARIAYLQSYLAGSENSKRPDVELCHAMQKELDQLEAEAAPLRELLGAVPQPGPPVIVEDGAASVDLPTVKAQAKTMKGGK